MVWHIVLLQVAFNRASYSVKQIGSVPSNLVGLALFLVLAAVLLWFHMRSHVRLFAEAAAITKTSNIEHVRWDCHSITDRF
jgi:hypothetical protein